MLKIMSKLCQLQRWGERISSWGKLPPPQRLWSCCWFSCYLQQKREYSLFLKAVQGSFRILFFPLTSADKTSSCSTWGRGLLKAGKYSPHPRDIQVIVFLINVAVSCTRTWEDMVLPVEGEQHSVSANQGNWKSLVLYYWAQYLVVE